ncbi:MAG: hypothetical protein QOH49_2145 [Acidobacteriota bacterium]|jgi:hypothetical protein|nr:hypothetical protein [Acidobacteriota bacterium]
MPSREPQGLKNYFQPLALIYENNTFSEITIAIDSG